MKPLEFKIPISLESYDEKTADNYRNCYVAKKRIVSKLSKGLVLVSLRHADHPLQKEPFSFSYQNCCAIF